jgi:hypothetical protein
MKLKEKAIRCYLHLPSQDENVGGLANSPLNSRSIHKIMKFGMILLVHGMAQSVK